jgi:hypothetical protein
MARLFGAGRHLSDSARQCFSRRGRDWVPKRAFSSESAAACAIETWRSAGRDVRGLHAYRCVYHGWHVGHERKRANGSGVQNVAGVTNLQEAEESSMPREDGSLRRGEVAVEHEEAGSYPDRCPATAKHDTDAEGDTGTVQCDDHTGDGHRKDADGADLHHATFSGPHEMESTLEWVDGIDTVAPASVTAPNPPGEGRTVGEDGTIYEADGTKVPNTGPGESEGRPLE